MAAITSTEHVRAWNIRLLECPRNGSTPAAA
jgi:hypothetical protein